MQPCFYDDCLPEVTGHTSNPAGSWCNRKIFAAGNRLSSNSVSSHSIPICKDNIGALYQDYVFPLIPTKEESNAGVSAGYYGPDNAYQRAQVWYGPTADEHNFYYAAYAGSAFAPGSPTTLSTVLVSRKRCDGSLNWAVNTFELYPPGVQHYYPISICRVAPAIYGDTLYISDGVPSPEGPMVFAVNKHTGMKKWGYALFPGQQSKTKVSNCNIVATSINDKVQLFVGVSSYQNSPELNVPMTQYGGTLPGFTDQGHIFRLSDEGTFALEVANISTGAPLIAPGSTVTQDMLPPPQYRVANDGMVIASVADPVVINPYVLGSDPDIIPASVYYPNLAIPIGFVATGAASVTLQDAWSLAGPHIAVRQVGTFTPISTTMTAAQVVAFLQDPANLGKQYFLTAYLDPSLSSTLVQQQNNMGLAYFRVFYEGDQILTQADAQGFNYYGNSTWGAPVTIDGDNGRVYFGTGQSHCLPFHEQAYYEVRDRGYIYWKNLIREAANAYVLSPSSANLQALNDVKEQFGNKMKQESIDLEVYSERGRMSYSDAVICTDLSLNFVWGRRTMPMDVYIFFESVYQAMTGYGQQDDGDISTGCHLFREQCVGRKSLGVAPKSGLACIFDHQDETNVLYKYCTYLGPSAPLGGANYQSTQSLGKLLLVNQANTAIFGARTEKMVTREGRYIPDGISFNCAVDIPSGAVTWNADLDHPSLSEASGVNGVMLTSDLTGYLYANDMLTGKRLLKYDTLSSAAPGNGGGTSACVLRDRILWTPSYNNPVGGHGAEFGASYKINKCAVLDFCKPLKSLVGNCYESTYHAPYGTAGPVLTVTQKWDSCDRLRVTVFLDGVTIQLKFKYCNGVFVELSRTPADNPVEVLFSDLLVFSKLRYQANIRVGVYSWVGVFNLK